jgi:plasmid stability protein
MPVMIQIRNVPDDIHRKLKARAAAAGLSMSDYILQDLKKLAEQPTLAEWFESLKKMKPIKTRETSEQTIRAIRDGR